MNSSLWVSHYSFMSSSRSASHASAGEPCLSFCLLKLISLQTITFFIIPIFAKYNFFNEYDSSLFLPGCTFWSFLEKYLWFLEGISLIKTQFRSLLVAVNSFLFGEIESKWQLDRILSGKGAERNLVLCLPRTCFAGEKKVGVSTWSHFSGKGMWLVPTLLCPMFNWINWKSPQKRECSVTRDPRRESREAVNKTLLGIWPESGSRLCFSVWHDTNVLGPANLLHS